MIAKETPQPTTIARKCTIRRRGFETQKKQIKNKRKNGEKGFEERLKKNDNVTVSSTQKEKKEIGG